MNTIQIRLVLATGALATLGATGATGATGAAAAQAAPADTASHPTTSTPTTAAAAPTVQQESGLVVEASGSAGATTASVTLYENAHLDNAFGYDLDVRRVPLYGR